MSDVGTKQPTGPEDGQPLVSIGLPVYNGALHLAEALRSALDQDYPNLEVVICDNASEDETQAICRRFEAEDSRVRYLGSPTNIGFLPNFRRALTEARGTYFTWLAHDDVLSDPGYLSAAVECLERNRSAVTCTTAFRILNSQFGFAGDVVAFPEIAPELWPRSRQVFFRWPHGWIDMTIYGVHRRELLLKVRLPERTYKGKPHIFWWETDVTTQLCRLGRIVALPEALRSYRLAVATEGTGLSRSVSALDLYIIGLRMKLIQIGRAWRMPGTRAERLRLVATALANLFRANLGQPYGHAYVSRNWEIAAGALRIDARERAELTRTLRELVLERRKQAESLSIDPGPMSEALEEALQPLDDSAAEGRRPAPERYSRNVLADFFLPPSNRQIELRARLQSEIGDLNLLCADLLRRIQPLHGEAGRLQDLIERASKPKERAAEMGSAGGKGST
jgi:glycosyltransferase involved in cell wall biosynthesis